MNSTSWNGFAPTPSFTFDVHPPDGRSYHEHMQNEHWGLAAYVMACADLAKGFRMMVGGMDFLNWFAFSTPEFQWRKDMLNKQTHTVSFTLNKGELLKRVGTWRGYEVYADIRMKHEMVLVTKLGGPVLGQGMLVETIPEPKDLG